MNLQDSFGLNINLILWCLWSGDNFSEPDEIVIRKAKDLSDQWSSCVVEPMRAARRALKSKAGSDAASLYDEIKAIELKGEKVEQEMLERLSLEALAPAKGGGANRARRILASYGRLTDAARRPGFSVSLLEDLIETIFPPAEGAGRNTEIRTS